MKISLLSIVLLSSLLFYCCKDKTLKNIQEKSNIHYLTINQFTLGNYIDRFAFLEKEFSIKGYFLPKSKNIYVYFKISKSAKKVLKHSILHLQSNSKYVNITQIKENEKFKIFIDENFKDSILTYDVFLITKKNYFFKEFLTKGKYRTTKRINLYQQNKYVMQ